ncbi:MAG: phospholipase D-like domain-containing protein [bacterium]
MNEITKVSIMEDTLKENICNTYKSIIIISAFVTSYGINFIKKYLNNNITEKIMVIRGRLDDFIMGSSDIEILELLEDGWKIFFYLDLHTKKYIFDKSNMIFGSSNLTMGGLDLNQESNYIGHYNQEEADEIDNIIGFSTEITKNNIPKIIKIYEDALLVDEEDIIFHKNKWQQIFADPIIKDKLILETDLVKRESLYLKKWIQKLNKTLRDRSGLFLEKISKEEGIDYISLSDVKDLDEYHYTNTKYKYLLRYFKYKYDYYKEKITNNLLEEVILDSNLKKQLLEEINIGLRELHTQGYFVVPTKDNIAVIDKQRMEFKFKNYSTLEDKDISCSDIEFLYTETLKELFGEELVGTFRLGGENN